MSRCRRRRLILFTRYPQPGKAKTRLIPALGAAGAANLHRQMVEHTLTQVEAWLTEGSSQISAELSVELSVEISVEIWVASLAEQTEPQMQAQMQDWLGSNWPYRAQQGADLGERLIAANQAAFEAGMQQVITIGTDCPGLSGTLIQQAFQQLEQHDLVLGPAADGGYYLIGLRQFIPALFGNITWSSEWVLQQTSEIAANLGLSVTYLEMLADVDRPADLAVWEAVKAQHSKPKLSVIIPVLNEANSIELLIKSLAVAEVEVIVVDGGSQDQTVELARGMGAQVVQSAPGRAVQMNAGAAIAGGEVLLFLHADSQLPDDFTTLVQQALAAPGVVAGAFALHIAGPEPSLRWIERGVNWRSRWLQLPYGDQAIFLKAATFRQVGGFAVLPLMEDFELVRRLQKLGRIAIAPATVSTSARRWQKLGVLKTTLINQLVIAAYLLGVSPQQLARWYRGNQSKHQD